MNKPTIEIMNLIQALKQSVGNKKYFHEIEQFLSSVEPTPEQRQAIRLLTHDIRYEEVKSKREKKLIAECGR